MEQLLLISIPCHIRKPTVLVAALSAVLNCRAPTDTERDRCGQVPLLGTWILSDSLPPSADVVTQPVVPGAITGVSLTVRPGGTPSFESAPTQPLGCQTLTGDFTGRRSTTPDRIYGGLVHVARYERDSVFLDFVGPQGPQGSHPPVAGYRGKLVDSDHFRGLVRRSGEPWLDSVTLTRQP